MKAEVYSPARILRRIADPIEAFRFRLVTCELLSSLLQCLRNSFWQRPSLFHEVSNRPKNHLKSVHNWLVFQLEACRCSLLFRALPLKALRVWNRRAVAASFLYLCKLHYSRSCIPANCTIRHCNERSRRTGLNPELFAPH
jgi:hypothetical protein